MGEKNLKAIAVGEFLADHDGVISTAQALNLGMSRDEIYGKRSSGLWMKHGSSVFLSIEHQISEMAMVRIAALAHGGVIDRESAVWLHGLVPDLPSPITLSIPRSGHPARCTVATRVCRRTYPSEDLARVQGVEVTALPLTVLIGAALLDDGIDLMDRSLLHRRVSLPELRAAAERNAGLTGMREARKLLKAAEDQSESVLERRFVRFLRRRGIDGWFQQVRVGGARIDFVWPEEKVAVQLHGWAFHHAHNQWERDQAVTNMLVNLGWRPLVFTWKRLEYTPDDVYRELMSALGR